MDERRRDEKVFGAADLNPNVTLVESFSIKNSIYFMTFVANTATMLGT